VAGADRTSEPSVSEGRWVHVRNAFDGKWSPGFVVDGVENGKYRLRRARDGEVLPSLFSAEDIRPVPRNG
jgi:hypothetical protein